MRKWYAIEHSEWSMNDSAEKIREWGTAAILAFASKRERDEWCDGDPYRIPLTRKRARRYVYSIEHVRVIK